MKLFRFILFIAILNSCEKEKSDFRDEFTGKYKVHVTSSPYGPCGFTGSEYDTVIVVDYGMTDSTLLVLGRDVHLDDEGYFYDYHYSLRLWDDSIRSYYMAGGLGCGHYVVHIGAKQ